MVEEIKENDQGPVGIHQHFLENAWLGLTEVL